MSSCSRCDAAASWSPVAVPYSSDQYAGDALLNRTLSSTSCPTSTSSGTSGVTAASRPAQNSCRSTV